MLSRTTLRPFVRTVSRVGAPRGLHTESSSGLPPPRPNYRAIVNDIAPKLDNALARKAPISPESISEIPHLYEQHRHVAAELSIARHKRSAIGDRIKEHIANKSVNTPEFQMALQEAKELKPQLSQLEEQYAPLDSKLLELVLSLPNDTHPDVPKGPEECKKVLSTHGPSPITASPQRDHLRIGRKLGLFDLESAATVTGSSWYYLKNEGALLEMALVSYALSIATRRGFTPVTTPDVVGSDIATRCGFQPRDPANPTISPMYHVSHELDRRPNLVLAGTAEIPLAGMFANQLLALNGLPVKVVGLGRAFRPEAGSSGVDTRGLFRVHQFTKLELFVVTEQNASDAMLEELRSLQTEIFEGLGLTFQVLDMPTEELGASAYRKYDIEAWMPGRGSWGEISSASNCTDYQARRLHIRYEKRSDVERGLPFAHTLNGTAVAVPRLIVALIENGACFNEAGEVEAIKMPKALRPFWIDGLSHRNIIRWD